MKVGLLDTFGTRWTRFWEPYLQDLGADLVRPARSKRQALELGEASLADEPPHVQLALGRILELGSQGADLVLLPTLVGVAGDPWGEAFADVLVRRVSSLPTLVSVPPGGDAAAGPAAELGLRLTGTPQSVHRALDRRRPLLSPPRETMPPLSVASRHTFAVVGPETLLAEEFLLGTLPAELKAAGVHAVFSTTLPRDAVLERGLRAGSGTPGERELAGALGVLENKGAVRGVILAVAERDGATRTFAERLATSAHKPVLVQDVSPNRDDWAEVRRFVDRVLLGASSRAVPGGE